MTDEPLAASRWRKFNQSVKKVWNPEKGSFTFYLPRSGRGYGSFEETVDALPDPGPEVESPGSISTLTVVVASDADDERLQMIYATLSVMRGVVAVKPNVADEAEYAAMERAKHELRKAVLSVIAADTAWKPFPKA